jgi:hypothetical protein
MRLGRSRSFGKLRASDNVRIDIGFRADLIVEDKVIVEIKSVEALAPVHKKQLHAFIKEGIARVVNGLEDEAHAKPPSRKDA